MRLLVINVYILNNSRRICFRLSIGFRPSDKYAEAAMASLGELVNSCRQAHDALCSFDSCHWCELEQRELKRTSLAVACTGYVTDYGSLHMVK